MHRIQVLFCLRITLKLILAKTNFINIQPNTLICSCCKWIRSIVVLDDIFCIFVGALENIADLRHHYGLPRQATEAMIVIEAYKVLRDRAPYPPDQVVRHLDGKFAFIIFDARTFTLFIARVRSHHKWSSSYSTMSRKLSLFYMDSLLVLFLTWLLHLRIVMEV